MPRLPSCCVPVRYPAVRAALGVCSSSTARRRASESRELRGEGRGRAREEGGGGADGLAVGEHSR